MAPVDRRKFPHACLLIFASMTAFVSAASAKAASPLECAALVKLADIYSAGKLSEPYRSALVDSGRAVAADGSIDRITIMNGCNSGAFDSILAGKDKRGSNNDHAEFTEPQARAYFEKAGYKSIAGLRKDVNGIWRAVGVRDGTSIAITLDHSGNITAANGM